MVTRNRARERRPRTVLPPPRGWLDRRRRRGPPAVGSGPARVVHRVEMLGPHWHIVDYHLDDPDFLAIGPGGVFQVTVSDHGRSRVQFAGDVVQVDGQRPPYVALARRDAVADLQQMSAGGRAPYPGRPGGGVPRPGEIVYYGKPPEGCVS